MTPFPLPFSPTITHPLPPFLIDFAIYTIVFHFEDIHGAYTLKLLICGSRYWTDEKAIHMCVLALRKEIDTIVCGGANGADSIAEKVAREFNIPVKVYPANWSKYGKSAGPKRNQEMIDKESPDEVWAFPIGESRGTYDMINRAKSHNIPVRIFKCM